MWDGLYTDVRGYYEAQYTAAVEAWKNRIKGKNQYKQDNQSLCTLEEDAEEEMILDEPKGVVQKSSSNRVMSFD